MRRRVGSGTSVWIVIEDRVAEQNESLCRHLIASISLTGVACCTWVLPLAGLPLAGFRPGVTSHHVVLQQYDPALLIDPLPGQRQAAAKGWRGQERQTTAQDH